MDMRAVLLALGLGLASPLMANTTDDTQVLIEDCRAEGRAEGLRGKDLRDYVKACVADMQGIDLKNLR